MYAADVDRVDGFIAKVGRAHSASMGTGVAEVAAVDGGLSQGLQLLVPALHRLGMCSAQSPPMLACERPPRLLRHRSSMLIPSDAAFGPRRRAHHPGQVVGAGGDDPAADQRPAAEIC